MLNNPFAPSSTQKPRLQILYNNQPIPGALSCEVHNNAYSSPDTFSAAFALYADSNYGIEWWDSQIDNAQNFQLDAQFGFLPYNAPEGAVSTWTSLILGQVDHVEIDLQNSTVHVQGRDLSSLMVDARTQTSYFNQTASQVATALAVEHGLTPNVQSTSTLISRYYQSEHTHITQDQLSRTTTEWQLLTFLAQCEGFDVWVSGKTLNFQPHVDPSSNPWVIQWTPPTSQYPMTVAQPYSNAMNISLERSATLAKDIEVIVRSWNSDQGRGFNKIAKAQGIHNSSTGTAQKYVYTFPNLSEAEAQSRANHLLTDITRRERVVSFEMPGETTLTTRNMVQLTGTQSGFDSVYYIDSIKRSISFEGSFVGHVRVKNMSPQSQAIE